jgi:hypothetical protein
MQPPPGYGYGYGQPPYGQPPPKPKGPSFGAVIVFLLIGALFVVPLIVGGVIGFLRVRDRNVTKDPEKVTLTESYTTQNGFITAHYPADFAAKKLDHATVVISRRIGNGDEIVTLGALAIDKAVTDDIDEFARLMLVSVEKNVDAKGGTHTRGKRREAKCLGKYEGIEFDPTFVLPPIGQYVGKACFFIHKDRHYIIRYDVVEKHAKTEVPLLEKIIDATELPD